ncbi:GNAT family N-acetyltransferase [Methanobrevibacter sp.]|uniref:GNAT family N-acetyltransferase n=1 Tax=Methanobrevibacter sp. TaxID=66852 RepID=UPI0038695DF5
MDVFILTEGGKNFGFGHVARCSSIYQAFKKRDISPKFIINGDNSVNSILNNIEFEIDTWLNNISFLNSSDIVIIDSYLANLEIYEKISKKVSLTVSLDDNKRLSYPQGIVVNGLINAENLSYPLNDSIKYLLGSMYTPLRADFWDVSKFKINDDINNILITMGGNDLRNLTPKVLELLNTNFPEVGKKVIIADSFDNIVEIEYLKDDSVDLIYSPNSKEMLNVMSSVDLAISASGQTLYELACIGVPTIAIGIIDNQKDNINNWQNEGFIEYAGCWNNKNLLGNILEKIELLKDKNIRYEKRLKGIQSIDGHGSLRIVKEILKEYYIKNSVFREIKESDCLNIFEIANDDEVRQSSFNSDKIDLEDHKKWFRNILNDDSSKFLVLAFGDEIIGQLRFDFDEKYPVISISLNKNYRGLGLSKYLLDKGIEYIGKFNKIVAYIKKDNVRSISFFKSMGFKKDSEVIIKDCEAFKFIRG